MAFILDSESGLGDVGSDVLIPTSTINRQTEGVVARAVLDGLWRHLGLQQRQDADEVVATCTRAVAQRPVCGGAWASSVFEMVVRLSMEWK
ncbi:hypothetical protein NL676_024269 [Syzygium grande]|nr:hypothetical protein NL676_024269 [Syzygium grande]